MCSASRHHGVRRPVVWIGLALGLVAAAVLGWRWWIRPGPDMVAVLQANSRGVGLMEQFKYPDAVAAFEEVVRRAPAWLPGHINLGIALLNTNVPDNLARAQNLFEQILAKEPNSPHAHFCLGIILYHQGQVDEACPHFEAVVRRDGDDAAAWYYLGKTLPNNPERALACFRRATQLDPHLSGALYSLQERLRRQHPDQADAVLEEFKRLKAAEWDNLLSINYTEMGRYGEVIGRDPSPGPAATRTGPLPLWTRSQQFRIELAPGARWATATDFQGSPAGELRARVRGRFGATLVVLDYDRDGQPDLFLLGAVVEAGQVRNLLLRNEGDSHFRDVTAAAGLGGAHPSLGCCAADFDNDGSPDLFVTGIGTQRLFRNTGTGRFEDVTAAAGLDQLDTVCLGAAFVDLDQDGDLDLVVAQFAATAADALGKERAARAPGQAPAGLALFLNVGEAPARPSAEPAPALTARFRRADKPAELLGTNWNGTNLAVADLDLDRDLDLVLLADGTRPEVVVNDRLLRFRRAALPESLTPTGPWNGALVLDVNRDGRSDLFLVSSQESAVLLLNRPAAQVDVGTWFQAGQTNSPPLLHAQAVDLDLDGWTDVVGLSARRQPVLLHNAGGRLVHAAEALGRDEDWPRDLIAATAADLNGTGFADLLVWSDAAGLQLYDNRGNGHHFLKLDLTGRRDPGQKLRCNADGFGAWAGAQAGDLWTGAENTTRSAGLGQSRQPLLLGLGRYPQADVVRLRWPDGTWQAELNLPAGQVARIQQTQRKTISCPILFAWDGRRFRFVTDFLGAGTLGEPLPGGGYRAPRPEESVKIEADQLAPLDGHYVLKVAEPMDEVTYLDRLQLVVLDHLPDVRVYPDERFVTSGPPASQELLAFRQQIFPVRARDHRGRDVTPTLRAWDRDTVAGMAQRSWLGFAEEHWVELDFGDRLARFGPQERLFLCLAGWTDYPYPESIWAAAQAGVAVQAPVLERLGADGRWQTLVAEAGFPAGLPRLMTLEGTGKLGGPRCVLRLRTNMEVYWDQIVVAPLVQTVTPSGGQADQTIGLVQATCLEVGAATLAARGCAQEFSPDGRPPALYDYDRLEPVPVSRLSGRLTRLGNVTELLRDADDRFVIFGPGDEVTVRFDARRLPALSPGWARSFVLRTWGYCKDCAPFTATGDTVKPLPFRGMRTYPYGPDEPDPRGPVHEDYRRRYNTRQVGP